MSTKPAPTGSTRARARVDASVADGKRSFAALIPETAYGNAVEAQFREAVARKGARVVAIERYPAGAPGPATEAGHL